MRILVISNLYPPVAVGGYEIRCAHTVEWLSRRHEVLVLTSNSRRRGLQADPSVWRELPLLAEGPRGTLRAPFAAWRAVRVVGRALRHHRPDLVFVWNASHIPRSAVLAAQAWGGPLAFSLADPWLGRFVEGDQFLRYLAPGAPRRGVRGAWARVARLLNRLSGPRLEFETASPASIVWNSEALRRMTPIPPSIAPVLERVIYPASRHEALFSSVERSPSSIPTVAFVGRIEWEKAPDVACRAIARLRDSHRLDCRLVIVGGGKFAARRELEQLVEELAIGDRVEFRGSLPPEGVAGVLASVHALVVPSRWQEPFGIVCLEAALARVPVVASMSGGMSEMFDPEREALFFPIDDVGACAGAIARTLSDRAATEARVRAARVRADTYSLARYREEYDAFVDDAMRAAAPAPRES
ncbi:MAG TPA: glycosyltransferase family 4 protein [Solirubrobacteraceae bacterium]|jgi:glycosyltransferase involved in cell wall biosynthesis|nr:glycosyltransferase family 4 protein [Solirubrobacteraceae bacterium]